MKAIAPVTCGHAMDVPDVIPNKDDPFSPFGIIADKMPTPGAVISGCTYNKLYFKCHS